MCRQDRNVRVYSAAHGRHTKTFRGTTAEDGTLIKVAYIYMIMFSLIRQLTVSTMTMITLQNIVFILVILLV